MSIFIELDELEPEFLTFTNEEFDINNGVLRKYKGNSEKVIIPDGVIEIAEDAFENTHIREIVFPSTIKKIERFSFFNSAISKVTFNYGLEVIHDCAFLGCKSLEEIELPVTLKVIGGKAFSASGLKNLHIPENILYVASDAFTDTPAMDILKLEIKKRFFI